MKGNGPKAAGCLITSDDFPRLCASASAYGAQLGCGSCNSTLGLSIPIIVTKFDLDSNTVGQIFLWAGVGYFCGLCVSLHLMTANKLFLSKIGMSTFFICITAMSQALMLVAGNFWTVKVLAFTTFIGMGGTDNLSSVALSEMWGQRVQPWLQAKSALYAIGGTIPPLLMQFIGFESLSKVVVMLALSAIPGHIADFVYSHAPFHATSERLVKKETEYGLKRRKSEAIKASELSMLEKALTASTSPLIETRDNIVKIVLDSTEYCDVSDANRVNPTFEPRITKTLSFVTSGLEKAVINDVPGAQSIHVVPIYARNCIMLIVALYLGTACTIGGWFPTFVLMLEGSQEKGAYVSGVFFIANLVGSCMAIPCAVFFSNTTLIRFNLFLSLFGSAINVVGGQHMNVLCVGTAIMGYGLSTIIALSLTIVNDYGYTMNASATTAALMGGAFGSSFLPPFVGYFIQAYSPFALLYFVMAFIISFVLVYIRVHFYLVAHIPQEIKEEGEEGIESLEASPDIGGLDANSYQRARARSQALRNTPQIIDRESTPLLSGPARFEPAPTSYLATGPLSTRPFSSK